MSGLSLLIATAVSFRSRLASPALDNTIRSVEFRKVTYGRCSGLIILALKHMHGCLFFQVIIIHFQITERGMATLFAALSTRF